MLAYLLSSIWASPAQTLVDTVNVVGAMEKGIALDEVEKSRSGIRYYARKQEGRIV